MPERPPPDVSDEFQESAQSSTRGWNRPSPIATRSSHACVQATLARGEVERMLAVDAHTHALMGLWELTSQRVREQPPGLSLVRRAADAAVQVLRGVRDAGGGRRHRGAVPRRGTVREPVPHRHGAGARRDGRGLSGPRPRARAACRVNSSPRCGRRSARARLRNEVRLARQLSHPNVCRVDDIGEDARRLHYLSMEYVDGEDLAALLKRIGRLPRQGPRHCTEACAGLAAAHAKGVLHREFKPANIMIDGAARSESWTSGWRRWRRTRCQGRPQRHTGLHGARAAGRQGGVEAERLYALGLELYELFTGRRRSPARASRSCSASANRIPPRHRPR